MADIHLNVIRKFSMSQFKGKDTMPEIKVRKFLFANGFRYRLHDNKLYGKPDIVLPKYNTVIFVNGCFWHAHENCKFNRLPKTNKDYWVKKIQGNVERDRDNYNNLIRAGWNVLTVWECSLTKKTQLEILEKMKYKLLRLETKI